MNGFENPFTSQQPPMMPGRVIISKEPWQAPLTEELVELIKLTQTYEEGNVIKTEEIGRTVVPKLADGTIPPSASYLRQCSRCLSIISSCNTFTCKCGRIFCLACNGNEDTRDTYQKTCIDCVEKEKGGILYKFSKWLWG